MSRELLQKTIEEHHDTTLVKINESPNSNIQTLLFNDGEVVFTKGGDVFLQRSMFTQLSAYKNIDIKMPCDFGTNLSYMIVKDLQTAKLIRNKMIEYNNHNRQNHTPYI